MNAVIGLSREVGGRDFCLCGKGGQLRVLAFLESPLAGGFLYLNKWNHLAQVTL